MMPHACIACCDLSSALKLLFAHACCETSYQLQLKMILLLVGQPSMEMVLATCLDEFVIVSTG